MRVFWPRASRSDPGLTGAAQRGVRGVGGSSPQSSDHTVAFGVAYVHETGRVDARNRDETAFFWCRPRTHFLETLSQPRGAFLKGREGGGAPPVWQRQL